MYDFLNTEVISGKAISYLEFGVYKGESIKYFSEINSNPDSRFFGFDTFTGLPEDWIDFTRIVGKNEFDAGGTFPCIADSRVSFVKGLFQDTLPGFLDEFTTRNQLVIHNDSDLYSSSLYLLTYANHILVPGTIIIFDEIYSVMHEYRAMEDWATSYMRSYEVLAAAHNFESIAIRLRG